LKLGKTSARQLNVSVLPNSESRVAFAGKTGEVSVPLVLAPLNRRIVIRMTFVAFALDGHQSGQATAIDAPELCVTLFHALAGSSFVGVYEAPKSMRRTSRRTCPSYGRAGGDLIARQILQRADTHREAAQNALAQREDDSATAGARLGGNDLDSSLVDAVVGRHSSRFLGQTLVEGQRDRIAVGALS
jgi:hypothetical protein